jgi:hypothetical protein
LFLTNGDGSRRPAFDEERNDQKLDADALHNLSIFSPPFASASF